MILKTLTKEQHNQLHDPLLNKIWGIDTLIYDAQISKDAQMNKITEVTFNPPLIVPKEVTAVFKSSPYNFAITETNEPNQMVKVTKISWI